MIAVYNNPALFLCSFVKAQQLDQFWQMKCQEFLILPYAAGEIILRPFHVQYFDIKISWWQQYSGVIRNEMSQTRLYSSLAAFSINSKTNLKVFEVFKIVLRNIPYYISMNKYLQTPMELSTKLMTSRNLMTRLTEVYFVVLSNFVTIWRIGKTWRNWILSDIRLMNV